MSEATVRAQIKSTLEGVSGMGAVHDYYRQSRSVAKFLELIRSDGMVNGCMIRRRKTSTTRDTVATLKRSHHFWISFIYEMDDANASEVTFQALLEAVYTAFKSDITIGDTCINSEPFSIEDVDELEIGETLYHVADCLLICHERDYY